ncbi:MAG: MarC family protein [Puniceicoccales bacterium]|jgi:multiple antibiotic resistance protein|nr:MarC family protein [Puniceicoccales bacterium]
MSGDFSLLNLFFSTTSKMYVILNPVAAIAVMLGLSSRNSVAERINISKQVCTIGGTLLFIFALFGKIILEDIFHISPEAFQVGGGLYLFSIGLSMALSKESDRQVEDLPSTEKNAFNFIVTPLATPLLTGPGTITATLVQRTELPEGTAPLLVFFGALTVTLFLVYFTFFMGCKFSKYLKPALIKIIERLVGMVMLCLAIGSMLSGATKFLQKL